ncbi:uncharacterized protein LOC110707606 [Chenopodium quinoa]|uniref:uncharacterized protein LOC110707606 n=1 Tax=Chenopodium quinoa TaxID=63459 RepID=UPI000B77077A|nr:uncharacterized protein LOC110707606 [Chenopodium quinoa]
MAKKWSIHRLDVKNAFLHDDSKETIYIHQSPGFVDRRAPCYVCRLRKGLYGLKQAPKAWLREKIISELQTEFPMSNFEILERAGIGSCKPAATTVDTESKLSVDAVQQVCLFMHDPRKSHYDALKRIMRYVQGTIDDVLYLYPSASTRLITYIDAD